MRASWSAWLERLAGSALFAMLGLTVADVAGRYLFSRPLAGVIELIQYAMVIVVFAALPVVTARRQHVSISLLGDGLRGLARKVHQASIGSLCTIVLITLSWTLFQTAGSMWEQQDVIGFLRLPTYVAAYAMSALSFVSGVVCAVYAACALSDTERNAREH